MHESEKWKWSCSVVSDSLQPHGLQPTRLLHPWDFPGKSTGVGHLACTNNNIQKIRTTNYAHFQHIKIRTSVSLRFSVSSVQSLSRVRLFATPWTAACQASLSIDNSWTLLKLMSSSHLILCRPLLLLPSVFPSSRVFSNESVLPIRWPKYWSFSFSISQSFQWIFRTDIL